MKIGQGFDVHRLVPNRRLVLAGIDRVGDQPARFVAPFAGRLQRDIGIDTERNPLLLALKAVFEAPPPPALWRNLQVEPSSVIAPLGLPGRFGTANRGIGERHGGNSFARTAHAPKVAPTLRGCQRTA